MKQITATIYLDGDTRQITIDPKTITLSAILYLAQFNQLSITSYN